MGCVESRSEQRERRDQHQQRRKHQQDPRGPRDVKKTSRQHGSNGDHFYENVDDDQFQRQHFDRNSVLRHSKKRKKSASFSSTTEPSQAMISNSTSLNDNNNRAQRKETSRHSGSRDDQRHHKTSAQTSSRPSTGKQPLALRTRRQAALEDGGQDQQIVDQNSSKDCGRLI